MSQGSEGIIKARAVEDQLMQQTWQDAAYDLLPKLSTVTVPLKFPTANDWAPPDAVAVTFVSVGAPFDM